MPDRKAVNGKDDPEPKSQDSNGTPLKWAGDIVVSSEADPVELPKEKRIHQRRPIPLVPEGPTRDEEADE